MRKNFLFIFLKQKEEIAYSEIKNIILNIFFKMEIKMKIKL